MIVLPNDIKGTFSLGLKKMSDAKKISFSLQSGGTSKNKTNNLNLNSNLKKRRLFEGAKNDAEGDDEGSRKKRVVAIGSVQEGKFDADFAAATEQNHLIIPLKNNSTSKSSNTVPAKVAKKAPDSGGDKQEKEPLGFGLIVMNAAKKKEVTGNEDSGGDGPMLSRVNARPDFEEDVKHRPDEVSMESEVYEKIPVGEFGAALLRGMGWRDGQGIGRARDEPVAVKDPVMRARNLGLGAQLPTDMPEIAKIVTQRRPRPSQN